MFITRKIDYGLRVMVELGLRSPERVRAEELARAAGAPRMFVLKILGQLARAGLVEGKRGVGGGFRLAKRPSRISMLQILRVPDGRRVLNQCILEPRWCDRSRACAAHKLLKPVQRKLEHELAGISLRDLVALQRKLRPRRHRAAR